MAFKLSLGSETSLFGTEPGIPGGQKLNRVCTSVPSLGAWSRSEGTGMSLNADLTLGAGSPFLQQPRLCTMMLSRVTRGARHPAVQNAEATLPRPRSLLCVLGYARGERQTV